MRTCIFSHETAYPLPEVILLKFAAGILLMISFLSFPETALNAALAAMHAWYTSVAPALFPFMALMPLLTCPDSVRAWDRLLGRVLRPLLNLPGAAAPAAVIAMTAGSPAGAIAAVRICSAAGLSRSQLERILWCTCGLSPAFLVTGIGASMLSSPADGHILLRAQLFSQIVMLLLTRNTPDDCPLPPPPPEVSPEPVRVAAMNILTVCGYMVMFAAAAAITAQILRSEIAGLTALCLLDAPSGARALANLSINKEAKLLLLSAMCGFGGLCIAAQNLAACKNIGIRIGKYAAAKASHALLSTAATALQLRWNTQNGNLSLPPMEISALIAAFLTVPALIFWKKDPFLNKRRFEKLGENAAKNSRKPQDDVSVIDEHPQYVVK